MSRTTYHYQDGLTFVEIIIVLAILILVAAGSIGTLRRAVQQLELERASATVRSMIDEARASTLASKNLSQHGVHFTTSTVTLFQGSSYVPANQHNVVEVLPTSIEIYSISLTDGSSSTVFERLSGKALATGTVSLLLSAPNPKSTSITIFDTGLVLLE